MRNSVSSVNAVIDVPANLHNSTAIGRGVANFYSLEVSSELASSCWSTKEGPKLSEHIYLKAIRPALEPQQPLGPLPKDWAP
jgi:hypothetical protein